MSSRTNARLRRTLLASGAGVATLGLLTVAIGQSVPLGAMLDGAAQSGESSLVQRPPRPREGRPARLPTTRSGPAQFPSEWRTMDGWANNLTNPDWGAAAIQLRRETPVGYADGLWDPAGADRPSARLVSNVVCAQSADMPNDAGATDYLWQWGQFLDHDIDETPIASPAEPFDIAVPAGDPFFDPGNTGTAIIRLDRSAPDPNSTMRQQMNNITSFIDASNVYGSSNSRVHALRTNDGTGRLLTSPGDLLPYNTAGLDNAPTHEDPSLFVAGDIRANEQIGLTAMHTLWVREHNYHADLIRAENPGFTGDQVFEHARAIVGAEMQAITYNEFLPLLLGPDAIHPYQGYQQGINPCVSNVFATAAYRVGHTMLSSTVLRLGPDMLEAPEGHIALLECFFNTPEIENNGIDSILRGLAGKASQTIDHRIVDDVRNFLFGPPGAGGFDLASLNIQRGRDHGLATYNQVRVWFGRPAATTFEQINPDPAVHQALAAAYDTPGQIDAWVGLLAEPHAPGALVGETLKRALADQFGRLRDGDRFWYEAYLPQDMVDDVNATRLSDVIRRNTGIGSELQDDVFRVAPPQFCSADINQDNAVDVVDFSLFVQAWQTNDPSGDFTGDSLVNVFDFAEFLTQFHDGCGL